MNLLIVDDDPAIRDLFSLFVSMQGHTPYTAANGREGIRLLEDLKPDVVVLDIMMQPLDGWDTLTAIRTASATRDLVITMFSGKPPTSQELRQYGPWIDDYLMKPLEFKKLPAALVSIRERSLGEAAMAARLGMDGAQAERTDEYLGLKRCLYICRKFSAAFNREDFLAATAFDEERLRRLEAGARPGEPSAPDMTVSGN